MFGTVNNMRKLRVINPDENNNNPNLRDLGLLIPASLMVNVENYTIREVFILSKI